MSGNASIETGHFAELASAVIQQLPRDIDSITAQGWIENRAALQKVLRAALSPNALKLIRQMTLTIGGIAKGELARRLDDGGHSVSSWARDVMSKSAFTTLSKPTDIELGWSTVRDLGFDKEPTTEELFRRIKEVGDLCRAEVGPHLRLADKDQPVGTLYWIAMEPITDSDGDPGVFHVKRYDDGGRWLSAYYAHPARRWRLDDAVVFVLRK